MQPAAASRVDEQQRREQRLHPGLSAEVVLEEMGCGAGVLLGGASRTGGERRGEALVVRLDRNRKDRRAAPRRTPAWRVPGLADLAAQRQREPDDDTLGVVVADDAPESRARPSLVAARSTTPIGAGERAGRIGDRRRRFCAAP